MTQPILLVDGRNCAYRTAYGIQLNPNQSQHHPIVPYLKQLAGFLHKFKPSELLCFWDAPRATVWRNDIYEFYKMRDNKGYIENCAEILEKIETATKNLSSYLSFRTLFRENQETDDLIYSACRILYPHPIIIISSDKDFHQISYTMHNVRCYDPQAEKMTTHEDLEVSPAQVKALSGDLSDKIAGYAGIGPKKGAKLAHDVVKRWDFLESTGDKMIYFRNLLLIDLSYNPHLLTNDMYILEIMNRKLVFDSSAARQTIRAHKYMGAEMEFDRVVLPFKMIKGYNVQPIKAQADPEPDSEIERQPVEIEREVCAGSPAQVDGAGVCTTPNSGPG